MSILRMDGGASYFVKLNVLVLTRDCGFAAEVRSSLERQYDRSTIRVADTVDAAVASFRDTQHDVLIAEAGSVGLDFAELCREVRHGRVGSHPFPIVTAFLDQPDTRRLRQVIDCGPDDVLLAPVGGPRLLGRLDALSRARPPFVVTRDYVGPTRRRARPPGSEVIPEFPVPNPLAAKVKRLSERAFRRELDSAMARLNGLKIERSAIQIVWLAKAIAERVYKIGGTDQGVVGDIEQLLATSQRLRALTGPWRSLKFEDSTRQLDRVAREVSAARGLFDVVLLEELGGLARGLLDEVRRHQEPHGRA